MTNFSFYTWVTPLFEELIPSTFLNTLLEICSVNILYLIIINVFRLCFALKGLFDVVYKAGTSNFGTFLAVCAVFDDI